jgi:hypothetical protein
LLSIAFAVLLFAAFSIRTRGISGSLCSSRGRPRGIRNPKRRVPNLVARPLSPQALSDLLDRKPHLLRPLVEQLWPSPLATIDPAQRLGIDLSSLRTVEDCCRVLPIVLAGIARGEITPAEGVSPRGECASGCARSDGTHDLSVGGRLKRVRFRLTRIGCGVLPRGEIANDVFDIMMS